MFGMTKDYTKEIKRKKKSLTSDYEYIFVGVVSGDWNYIEKGVNKGYKTEDLLWRVLLNNKWMMNELHSEYKNVPYHDYTRWIKKLIDIGSDINYTDEEGNQPLHIAVKSYEYNYVDELIKQGANLNATNKKGFTPLHQIIDYNDNNYFAMDLIDERYNMTPQEIREKIINRLLDAGANPAITDNDHKRPIRLLESNGQRINKETTLRLKKMTEEKMDEAINKRRAKRREREEMAKLKIAHVVSAYEKDEMELFKSRIKESDSINDEDIGNIFSVIAKSNSDKGLKQMIELGYLTDHKYGVYSAIEYALNHKNIPMFKGCLAVLKEVSNELILKALKKMENSQENLDELIGVIIDSGVDLNKKNNDQYLLHYIYRNFNKDCILLINRLMAHGAKNDVLNGSKTPPYAVMELKYKHDLSWQQKEVLQPVITAYNDNGVEKVEELVHKGYYVDEVDVSYENDLSKCPTVLQLAIEKGDYNGVLKLLELGSNPLKVIKHETEERENWINSNLIEYAKFLDQELIYEKMKKFIEGDNEERENKKSSKNMVDIKKELIELKELLDMDIITKEEFDKTKKKILGI